MKDCLFIFGALYLILSFTFCGGGFIQSGTSFGLCDKPMLKMEILFPSYRVGCWLGTPIKGK